jgi:U3 small nucleolar RNA-associated protein 3
MAKKRKASSGLSTGGNATPQSSKLSINTFEDVADSEDEFLINRDKILLDEGPDAKRRRKVIEDGTLLYYSTLVPITKYPVDKLLEASDEEILAYPSSENEDEAMDSEDYDDEIDKKNTGHHGDYSSDFEGSMGPEEEDEEHGAWGESKQDYYGADEIDTEQAAKDEEEEAKRLQQKQLQGMSEADFGFDEDDWADGGAEEAEDGDGVVMEVLPQVQITDDMRPEERLKLLKSRYPECEPIAKEFVTLQGLYAASEAASRMAKEILVLQLGLDIKSGRSPVKSHPAVIRHQALSAYLGTMALYVAVLTSTADAAGTIIAKSPIELREHPIMDSLIRSRQLWNKVKDLQIPDAAEELAAISKLTVAAEAAPKPSASQRTNGTSDTGPKKSRKQKTFSSLQTEAQLDARIAYAEAEARRTERLSKLEEDLATLSTLAIKAPRAATKSKLSAPARMVINEDDSDLGDETELTAHELAEKAKKKRSLKFYTAQIAQKANKRGTAGKETGGDTDIPHRERLKDRQARLNAEAEKRGKRPKQPGDDLGGESDEDDKRQAREVRGEANSDGDEYYDMVAHRSKQKKERKAEAAEAYARAAAEGGQVHEVEVVGADGKRKITYQSKCLPRPFTSSETTYSHILSSREEQRSHAA